MCAPMKPALWVMIAACGFGVAAAGDRIAIDPETKCQSVPGMGASFEHSACYPAYAPYLLKFLRAYEDEGVPVFAWTLQNEPAHVDPNYPTCLWTGEDQPFSVVLGGQMFQTVLPKRSVATFCWKN